MSLKLLASPLHWRLKTEPFFGEWLHCLLSLKSSFSPLHHCFMIFLFLGGIWIARFKGLEFYVRGQFCIWRRANLIHILLVAICLLLLLFSFGVFVFLWIFLGRGELDEVVGAGGWVMRGPVALRAHSRSITQSCFVTLIELWVVLCVSLHLICVAEQGSIEGVPDNLERHKDTKRIYYVQKTAHVAEEVENLVRFQTVDSSLWGCSEVNVRVWYRLICSICWF